MSGILRNMLILICLSGLVVAQEAAVPTAASNAATAQPAKPKPVTRKDEFAGYDFEQVVRTVETSVSPLQQEMSGSLKVFSESVTEAQALIEEGKSREAIVKCSAAMEAVLGNRDKVLKPMWKGQDYLNEQIGKVRVRLALAIEAKGGSSDVKLAKSTENMLDGIASRISGEEDPMRKKRLVAHYKTVRQLAKIKLMAKQLSPNQRKLWRNVLGVLENTALTHQQVLMGTEVLFAQFEGTVQNLREYEGLIDTVEGASRLLGVVKGLGESGQGLAAFSRNMTDLQKRMAGFNGQIEQLLEDKMVDLEAQSDAITTSMLEDASETSAMNSNMDDELAQRLGRLEGSSDATSNE